MGARLSFLLGCLLFVFSGHADAQLSRNRKLYDLEKYGNDRASVRVLSDYEQVGKDMEFCLVYYFEVAYPWYLYTSEPSMSHRPLELSPDFPEGVEVVEKIASEGVRKDKDEVYTGSFHVMYRLKTTEAFSGDAAIDAAITWQCCDGRLCTMGNVTVPFVMRCGEGVKSPFYRNIRKMLGK